MQRLSTVFLTCFVALVIGLGGMITWKIYARRAPVATESTERADYRINEIHINETLEGNLRWTLDADKAEMFDKDQTTIMHQVSIRIFSQTAEWTVTAAEGVLDNEKRDVSLKGNVVVTSNDGLTLTTDALAWRNQERNLSTDESVEIKREGLTIVGRGLNVRVQEEHAVLGKRVRVVITNRANANLAIFPRSGS